MIIYIRGEKKVEKNRVIKVIKIRFTLLNRRRKLVIFELKSSIINSISRNTIYTTFRVNRMRKNY